MALDRRQLAVTNGGYFGPELIFVIQMSFIHLALARKKREEKEDKVRMASRSEIKIYAPLYQDHELSPVKTVLGSLVTDNTSQQEMKVVDRKTDKNTQEGTAG